MSPRTRGAPKVSVCVITYMHERYIARCLHSIVTQNTSFEFEIVVGVDRSADRSADIVLEFADRYPSLIRPIVHATHMGGCANYLATHLAATGRYVATMDGDDFMLPGKLERQAGLLDAQPEISVVWHPMQWIGADDKPLFSGAPFGPQAHMDLTLGDLVTFGALGASSSQMYRREGARLDTLPSEFLDFDVNVLHLQRGIGALIIERAYGGYQAGVGVTSTNERDVRRLAEEGFRRLLQSQSQYRPEATSWSLHLFLHDLKRRSPLAMQSWRLLLETLSFRGLCHYVQSFQRRRTLGKLIMGQAPH